jgi:hypothetical protein
MSHAILPHNFWLSPFVGLANICRAGQELAEIEAQANSPENMSDDDGATADTKKITSSSDLGFVWRIEEATEICQQGVPGDTGPKDVDPGDSPPRLLGPVAR